MQIPHSASQPKQRILLWGQHKSLCKSLELNCKVIPDGPSCLDTTVAASM